MSNPSIYNEENYFFHPEVIQSFQEMHGDKKVRWDAEKRLYRSTLQKYDEFVTEVAQFIKDLGYDSCLDCSIILSHLIKNGYLSQSMQFQDGSYNPATEINCRLGTSIVKGRGCCRNYAGMQQDVFEKLDLPTEPFYCYEGINLFHKEANRPANHVINLVIYDHNLYGIDLYNQNRLYSFRTPLILKEDSSRTNFRLRYKPYYEIIMGASLQDIKEKLYRYKEYSSRDVLSPMVYEDDIRFKAKKKMRQSEKQLTDFHEKTKVLKQEIAEGLRCEV